MTTGSVNVVRRSIGVGLIASLALAVLFLGAARSVGAPPVAQYGGALWVFMLSLLVALPLLTPLIRRRASR